MIDIRKIRISKLEAARRQLDCAISLWAADKDVISVHTLAGAAHEIISDIHKKTGKPHPLFDSDVIKDEYRDDFRKFMRKEIMFFKHADRDPHDVIEFVPMSSMIFMLVSISMLQSLGESLTDIQSVFHVWLIFNKPDWISKEYVKLFSERLPIDQFSEIRNTNKNEFFKLGLQAFGVLRAREQL